MLVFIVFRLLVRLSAKLLAKVLGSIESVSYTEVTLKSIHFDVHTMDSIDYILSIAGKLAS